MADRLPPLAALRAFDAAARHMSFARAAEELNMTRAALSWQIKQLEAHLGFPVFRRLNRAVELTEAGRALRPGVAEAFAAIRAAQTAARRTQAGRALTVTAGPAFTAKWLAPRLFRFAMEHPDVELRFVASLRLMDFRTDEIDAAIRFGHGDDTGLFAEPLFADGLAPLASPEVAARLRAPADLAGEVLLHDDSMAFLADPPDWAAWLAAEGVAGVDPARGPRFTNADHALDAAVEGGGVAMGRLMLAERDLAAGRLALPFGRVLPVAATYRFVCPPGAEEEPRTAAFLGWLRAEVARSVAVVDAAVAEAAGRTAGGGGTHAGGGGDATG